MVRVNYQQLAEHNAKRNRRALNQDGRSLCPETGEMLMTQTEAARRLGVTARALRDMALPAYSRGGRGGRTHYHAGHVEILRRYRHEKSRERAYWDKLPEPSPLQTFLSVGVTEDDIETFEVMMKSWDNLPEIALALSSGDVSERYIDPVGAKKIILLAREIARVAKEHCGLFGVYGEQPEEHEPDPDLCPQSWDFAGLDGDVDAGEVDLAPDDIETLLSLPEAEEA